jgi:tetratricopeptide (TPR) repeat protein
MKKIVLILLTACSLRAFCQMNLPEFSPEGKVLQSVGYANFVLRYGRPAARGRKIFGELVPYGKLWRTGAGKCTTIQFDQVVIIGEREIKPGIYALVSIPEKDQWTILLNSDTNKIYGAPEEYDTKTEAARFIVKSKNVTRFYESLSLELDVVKNNGELYISWETTQVHFPILTNSNKKALEEINKTLSERPDDADNLSYSAYYLEMNNENPELVLSYIDKALKLKEDWWFYEVKVDQLLKNKKVTEAKQASQKAIEFLTRTKPLDWEMLVKQFTEKLNKR